MKIHYNVLSSRTLSAVNSAIDLSLNQNKWSVSTFWWSPEIKLGNRAGIATQIVSPDVAQLIYSDIQSILPQGGSHTFQYYLWPEGSNISTHDDADSNKIAGATIYLNDRWHPDFGGIFLWEDGDTKEMKCLCPSHNTMVVNDRFEQHLVTPVTSAAPVPRRTVQIWVNN
jgi:Rps23 Pro-64 3,4-dihydroxylase Tpa1-like proline 4-hydroxylase